MAIYPHEVRLKSMELKHFRGFQHVEIDFNQQLTIIIAENGGGKTTILDAINKFCQYITYSIFPKYEYDNRTNIDDIHISREEQEILISSNKLHCEITYHDIKKDEDTDETYILIREGQQARLTYEIDKDRSNEITSHLLEEEEIDKNEEDESISHLLEEEEIDKNEEDEKIEFYPLDDFGGSIRTLLKDGNPINLPILVYYPCNALTIKSKKDNFYDPRDLKFSIRDTYLNALDGQKAFDFKQFYLWIDKQQKLKATGSDRQILDLLSEVVGEMLGDEDTKDNGTVDKTYQNLRVDWSKPVEELILDKAGVTLNFNQLSSGEKMLFVLVVDITRRLSMANPHSKNPLNGSGIVLIDEIDLHLHPKWQRKVVGKLRALFPNVQFVITTHSPLVLGSVGSQHIRKLVDSKVYNVGGTKGHKVDAVLKNVMRTDSSILEESIKTLFHLIATGELENAKQLIEEIETQSEGKLPDILKAELLIQRKEMLSQ